LRIGIIGIMFNSLKLLGSRRKGKNIIKMEVRGDKVQWYAFVSRVKSI
jgi:hypothetical protein